MEKKRNILFDNLRVLLILLVIYGHAMEQIRFDNKLFLGLYNFIYLFHMPLFVFCSGAFAKSDKKRIVKKYLIPYVVFQALYGIFDVYVMEAESFHFLESYYVLWYLLALAVWSLVLPVFHTEGNRKKQMLLWLASVMIGLLAGYVDWIGKAFSLSRILVFFPFFLAGYYIRQEGMGKKCLEKALEYKKKKSVPWICGSLFVVIFLGIYCGSSMINTWALYGYTSYAFQGYTICFRVFQYLAGIFLGILLFMMVPGEKPLIPYLASHTMGIYLGHVMVIKILEKAGIAGKFSDSTIGIAVYSLVVTMVIVIVGMGVSQAVSKRRQERKNK